MKVLLVSTSDKIGGAAIACTRIFNALRKNGVSVKMLVRDKVGDDPDIYTVNTSLFRRAVNFMAFCFERLRILFHLRFSKKNLFQVSLDNWGTYGLLDNPLVKEADVINFHWTSQGMVSLGQLAKLAAMGKRMVFTMHDMHSFTGICHYARNCRNFEHGCGNCLFLNGGKDVDDLSRRWFSRKMELIGRSRTMFVACSQWLADIARTSRLMNGTQVCDIPNPINTDVFRSIDKMTARARFGISRKYVVLFGAVNIADKRKGFKYLQQALQEMDSKYPDFRDNVELLIFGQSDPAMLAGLPYHYTLAGYLKTEAELVSAYSAADVYVTPSLEDNLPNTVMEALSCGTPCVVFQIGGLPQLIDHRQNGYLARYMDSGDLADGIAWVIVADDATSLSHNARKKVEENFSEPVIAIKYRNVYRAVGN